MATEIILTKNGIIKSAFVDFSGTFLIFGCLVPLYRKDFVNFFKILAVYWLISIIAKLLAIPPIAILGYIAATIFFSIKYNKMHLERLLMQGWKPKGDYSKDILNDSGYSFE